MASSQMPSTHLIISPKSSSSTSFLIPNSFLKPLLKPTHLRLNLTQIPLLFRPTNPNPLTFSAAKTRAAIDEANQETDTTLLLQEEKEAEKGKPTKEVEESVKVLKNAAKTRRVAPGEILSAFSVLEKAKLDPSGFLETLGGTKSPGRTWMLVFTAEKGLKSGKYFPLTAVQRFDAAGKKIENGVYLGSLGCLTFEGRISWKKRILAFIFECIRIKIGPFNPFEVQFGGKDEREPSTKDPFFIWFYIDEEIAVARGRSGGTAFWVRCRRVPTY